MFLLKYHSPDVRVFLPPLVVIAAAVVASVIVVVESLSRRPPKVAVFLHEASAARISSVVQFVY